ncbi:hypothetical protein E8E15_010589 [Penicillium rubens]|uniref:Pc20g14210 protein n=2 Tax=Penicillium chrysogenum species complex TaxID=254878 RepID=B6HHA7_PENRW|nr:uncharacterized protein N7525_009795 [Penicillium rubens]KZN86389.1 hypothetical protein EN45_049110 [Penicillium chrysogenum]CAP86750.1 Pc20g14210 [Penicillium rubens Wisconsin 54-1255]KAF3027213.1 hypothetical protein E8E15_010589 [Penicillium rubens]KAJ5053134.1 hypothetical protein NUH16_010194 [Penicillium rubens]KAJ5831542.1 hypothetical protein N7525_009795 [Penicillium rubens]
MSRQPINLISDTESESESDGGMQLDDLDRVDGIPMFGSEGDGLNVDGIPMPRPGRDDDDWDVNGDTSNESDTRRFTSRAPNPLTTSYNGAGEDDTEPQTAFEKDARTRSHLRDEKHAALAVLMDNELLVTYALASQETIPQTRRRFLAKYLAPNDPAKAEELYDPRFYIAPDGKGGEGSLIRGRYREVIGDINDHNWHKPAHLRAMDAKKARGGGSRSGSGSRSCSGANSPGAFGGVGLGAGEGRGGGGASLVGRGLGQGRGRGVDEDEDEDL